MAQDGTRTKLTYEDLLLFPEGDGLRHEIIDGEHFVNASPTPRHQRISGEINDQLRRQVKDSGRGEVFYAPLDVVFSQHDVVEPDLVVVLKHAARIVGESCIEGAPDLVVEILSPSASRLDRKLKLKLYEVAGVPEYWIADPDARVVHQHVAERSRYRLVGSHGDRVDAGTIADVTIDLSRVW